MPEPSLAKEKELSRQSRVSDHEEGDSQGEREPHLGETEGDQSENMERRKWDSTMKEVGLQGGEGGQARRAFLGAIEGSMSKCVDAKSLQDDLQSLGFTLSLAKFEMGKKIERRRACS